MHGDAARGTLTVTVTPKPCAAKIGALAPWFCASRTLAPIIAQEIGRPRLFWNEFCGSLAVTLAVAPCVNETVNDLHGDIINLARVVQREGSAVRLFDRVQRTMMHESVFDEAAARFRGRGHVPATDEPDEDRAYDYLVSSWLGRNGVAGTSSYNQGFCVRYTANGGHAAKRFRSVAESIPAWYDRLRNVTVLNRNARDTIPRIDDREDTVVYLDPPYVEKGAGYVHDFAPASPTAKGKRVDAGGVPLMTHGELRDLLARFRRARIIVSYYDHPLVRELYRGWTLVRLKVTKSLVNQGMRDADGPKPDAPEILLINGPSVTAGFAAETA